MLASDFINRYEAYCPQDLSEEEMFEDCKLEL